MRRMINWIRKQWTLFWDSGAYHYAQLYGGPEVVDLLYEKAPEEEGD